jgi:predicted PurR-regulated permease PerM
MIRLEFTLRGVLTILGVLIGLWLLIKVWPVMLLVIVSLMLAAALFPFFEWMVRHGLSPALTALALVIGTVFFLALTGFLVIPAVIDQVRTLIERWPELRDSIATTLEQRQAFGLATRVRDFDPTDILQPNQVADTGRRAIGIITSIVTVVFLTLYMLLEARQVERFLLFAIPNRFHVHVHELTPKLQRTVGAYIRGQAITSLLITVFTFIVCLILGVPNAISLAVLAGIADAIPLIGGLLTVIPATLAALTISVPTAIVMGVLLVVYQEFENRILIPRVYGASLRLPTLVVFIALLIGAKLAGIIGALLSLPVAAALRVIIEYAYSVRTGREMEIAPEEELFAPDNNEVASV